MIIKGLTIEKLAEMDFWIRNRLDESLQDFEIVSVQEEDRTKEVTLNAQEEPEVNWISENDGINTRRYGELDRNI